MEEQRRVLQLKLLLEKEESLVEKDEEAEVPESQEVGDPQDVVDCHKDFFVLHVLQAGGEQLQGKRTCRYVLRTRVTQRGYLGSPTHIRAAFFKLLFEVPHTP